jgi:hypothetical protein
MGMGWAADRLNRCNKANGGPSERAGLDSIGTALRPQTRVHYHRSPSIFHHPELFMSPFLAVPLVTSLLAATSPCFAQAVAPAVPTQPSAPAGADTVRIGTFKQIEGDTRMGRAGAQRTPTPGDGVNVSQRLSTGKNGAATIILKDGTVLTMGPDTTMDLSQFHFDSTTQQGNFVLDLLQGSVRVVTGLLARINPELFKINTPTSVVGVRGTDFIVEAQTAQ